MLKDMLGAWPQHPLLHTAWDAGQALGPLTPGVLLCSAVLFTAQFQQALLFSKEVTSCKRFSNWQVKSLSNVHTAFCLYLARLQTAP